MCMADVSNAKIGLVAPSRKRTRLLGTIGGSSQPIGTYSRRSELTSGTTKNGPVGMRLIWNNVGVSARARVEVRLLANLRLACAGGDPLAEKRRLKSMPTFATAAEAVLAQMRPGWRNPKHGEDWLSSMEPFAFPWIGKLPVSEVTSADVVETLRKVWHERPATARRVRQRISTVMEWAVALNYRDDDPCSRIGPILGPQQALVRHMPALPHRDVAATVETVRASGAAPVVKPAFEFLVLTAARSGEVRGAEWTEIDTEEHVCSVPATRTKAKREHRVPLTRRAEQVLDAARTLSNGNALVFPSPRGKRFNDMALSALFRTLEVPAVPHGFRSTFRDWAAEETDHPREVVEAALAHAVRSPVEAAYARSDLFERRRLLMDEWAAYVVGSGGRADP